ncbi:glycosyltransferase [Paenibacillus sp. LMG 31461]|uniref:Glycosyltransferase n=1 Tax=Paenibacillus plantarum TaxID=2654975 RepID=A0ABX1X404_9BACL|nr:glycosyltransferase [Paenibacillus plantarum]NOU63131.1 glycosyltransferase [Paenibacillus plantarum]
MNVYNSTKEEGEPILDSTEIISKKVGSTRPKISVIVTVYNTGEFLSKCLQSIVNQTIWNVMELVIINDGSTDHSSAIIKEFVKKQPERIISIHFAENQGVGNSRNVGIAQSRGDYIGFVDSDDWIANNMFEVLYTKALDGHDMVICDYFSRYEDEDLTIPEKGYAQDIFTQKQAILYAQVVPWNKLYKKELLQKIQYLNIWYEDVASTPILISLANKPAYLNIPLYYYKRSRPGSIANSSGPKVLDILRAWDRLIGHAHLNNGFKEEILFFVSKCINYYIDFKPEYADHFWEYARKHRELLSGGEYNRKAVETKEIRDLFGLFNKSTPMHATKNATKYATPKKRSLRIIQVISPVCSPVSAVDTAGTEKIVYEITQELVKRGHKVILYAPKGSKVSAKLVPFPKYFEDRHLPAFIRKTRPSKVDLIHDHTFTSIVRLRKMGIPVLPTHHLPTNKEFHDSVYVSRAARRNAGANGQVVHNGINPDEYEYSEGKDDYLLFIGRILPDKGVIHAIEVAERNNQKLIIAGPIKDEEYFRNILVPRIDKNENIHYIGAVAGKQKQDLLKRARCVLFPSIWKEPFGLVLIEAMISGTPVLALNNGAAIEVLEGFPQLVCNSIDELAHKALKESFPPPHVLREYVLNKFTTSTMVDQYITLYEQKINELKRRRGTLKRIRRRKKIKLIRRKKIKLVRRRKNLKMIRRKRPILKKKITAKRSVTKRIRTIRRSVKKRKITRRSRGTKQKRA